MVAFAWRVLVWLVLLSAVVVLAAAVVVPRLTGATPYTVMTGSMRPHYPPGTLVVVKPVPVEDVRTGDVITYQLRSGEPAVVTHRVVEVGADLDGDVSLTTQGDANDVPDAAPVRPVQVKGRLWYALPYLGYANNLVTGQQRQKGVLLLSGGLVAYAAWMFAGAAAGRRRRSAVGDDRHEGRTDDRTEEECLT
ncbi:signal peptidase I [Nocardioides sp. MH1]|uniref:signal peptidase I n=1 Tax=Nocardioides sp. MH1 TaxID=3242490 RepID=UPI0035229FD1